MTCRSTASEESAKCPKLPTPALLIRTSNPPKRSTTSSTSRCRSSGEVTSAAMAKTSAPRDRIASATSCSPRLERAATATDAPPVAASSARLRPIPREPPVINILLPGSDLLIAPNFPMKCIGPMLPRHPKSTRYSKTAIVLLKQMMQEAEESGAGSLRGAPVNSVSASPKSRTCGKLMLREGAGPNSEESSAERRAPRAWSSCLLYRFRGLRYSTHISSPPVHEVWSNFGLLRRRKGLFG